MKHLTKAAAGLLCLAMLLPACAADPSGEDTTAADGAATSAPADMTDAPETTVDPDDRSQIKANIPDDVKFDGMSMRVLYRGDDDGVGLVELYDVRGTDNAGDYVTDGVWYRNNATEDRLGIDFEITATKAGDLNATKAFMKQVMMSGSDDFDYINGTGNSTIVCGLNTYLRDLSKIPYVDYDAPYWWNEAIAAAQLDSEVINYIFGDMLSNCYLRTGVIYYNKTLYGDVYSDPDALYTTVMDGEWTIDKLCELTAGAYKDANGDGVENKGDIFGALKPNTTTEETPHFFTGFDLELYHKDENDNLVIEFDQERCVTAIDKLGAFYNGTPGVFAAGVGLDALDAFFVEGDYLFYASRLTAAVGANMRNMENPYGILPYPKLDETQDSYISYIHESASDLLVPKSVSDEKFEAVGATLEFMCAEHYRSVTPLLLDTALKVKYSQDQMSGKVIDLVLAGVTKNTLAEYYDYTANIMGNSLYNPAKSGKNNFASAYKKSLTAAQKSWDKALSSMGE